MEKKLKQELKAVQKKISQKKKSRHDNSSQSDDSSNHSDSDYWLKSSSKHGGQQGRGSWTIK